MRNLKEISGSTCSGEAIESGARTGAALCTLSFSSFNGFALYAFACHGLNGILERVRGREAKIDHALSLAKPSRE